MPTLTTRASKGSQLTHNELDANFVRTVRQIVTTDTVLISDNRSLLEVNHATVPFTVTLGDAATMVAADTGDFEVTFANTNAAAVTIARAGSDTINGAATSIVLEQNEAVTLKIDSTGTNYQSMSATGVRITPTPLQFQVAVWDSPTAIEGTAGLEFTKSNHTVKIGDGTLAAPGININGSAASTPIIVMQQAATNRVLMSFDDSNNRFEIDTPQGEDLAFLVAGGTQMVIDTGGNLTWNGMAYTASGNLLVIGGSTPAPEMRLTSSASGDPIIRFFQTVTERASIEYQDTGDILVIDSASVQLPQGLLTVSDQSVDGLIVIDAQATGDPAIAFRQTGLQRAFIAYDDTTDNLEINSGVGQIELQNAGTATARTETALNGGLEVNNQNTGAGFERVLTESDLVATAVATNHIRAGNTQILSDTAPTVHDVAALTASATFETFGPTGSGATNIIDDMDDMPSSATIALFKVFISGVPSSTTQITPALHADSNDVAVPVADTTNRKALMFFDGDNAGSNDLHGIGYETDVMIPVDSTQIFKATWVAANTSARSVGLRYMGFMTD